MDRKPVIAALALAAGIALAMPPAFADRGPSAVPSLPAPAHGQDMRLSRLIGMDVRDAQGNDVGEIEDLVIDTRDGLVRYAVIDAGGFLGIDEHRTAVPISRIRATYDKEHIVTGLSADELRRFPSYPPERRPDWNDRGFLSLFGDDSPVAPTPRSGRGQDWTAHRLRRASDLLDATLRDTERREIGEVRDLVVNLRSGQVKFGLAELDADWADGRLVVLHPRDVRGERDGGLVVVASRERLREAPMVSEDRWDDLDINSADFRMRLQRGERG